MTIETGPDLRFPILSEDQERSYLLFEQEMAKTTRDHAVEHVKKTFLRQNPGIDVVVRIWMSDCYGWFIAVFPNVSGGCHAIATYWVQKFPTPAEITESNRQYEHQRNPDTIFVDFAELPRE